MFVPHPMTVPVSFVGSTSLYLMKLGTPCAGGVVESPSSSKLISEMSYQLYPKIQVKIQKSSTKSLDDNFQYVVSKCRTDLKEGNVVLLIGAVVLIENEDAVHSYWVFVRF